MLRKSEFNLKSALSALKDRGQGGDARQSSRKLTVILSTVLAVAILATVVVVSLPGSRAMAATSSGVITSVYGDSVIPSHYNAMNVPAGTYLMTKDNYTSGKVTQSTDGVASFDFHIFADRFSSGVHTCGNIAVNLLGADVLGNAAAPEFGSRSSHDIDVPKLSYVGDLYGWSAATTNEYLVFGHDVDVTGNGQVWVELADGNTAMMGNDNGGSLLDSIYIENNGSTVEPKDGYLYIQGELDEAEDYQRWLIWLMEKANAENGNKNSKYATTITQSDGSTESVQYLHYNDLVSWNYWGWSSPNLDFSSYDADTIVIDLPTYQGYDWWTYQQVTYSYALQMIYNTVQMTGTAGKRIVFNVCTDGMGDNFSFFSTTMSADNLANSEGTAELDNNILWNFYETGYDSNGNKIPVSYDGVISVSGTWVGSILAPDATVSCGAGLNGSIIAKNVVTFCETHKSDYTGERVTQTSTSATVTKVWRDDPSMRPAYITIQLLRNGEVVNSMQMTSSNASADDANVWTYTFENLPAADTAGNTYQYKFAEIVPSGYEMEQVGNTIINTATSVPETIVPTYELTVYKTDGSANLSGASLMLTSNSGANLSSASVANASSFSVKDSAVTWVSSGTPVVISGLPAGSYTVTETSAPSGYKVAASQNVTISGSGEITVVNTPITVELNKYNGENDYKDQLPGASFELKANWGTTLTANMVSGASAELRDYKLYWTNGTSPVTLSGIPAGSYTLTELTAPDGFDLAAPVTFIVYSDGSIYVNNQLVSSVDVYNYLVPTTEQVYNLTVNKTGGTSANALAGANMVLTNVAGKNLEDYKDSITINGASCTISGSTISWTTGNSAVTFNGLPAGNYVLSETSAPAGYKKAADISITLNADGNVTMHDASIELNISKLDSLSGAQLTGAQLTLTEDNGADLSGVTSSTVTLSKNGSTISWTSNGKAATFTNLPAGTYTLTENDAPSGYSEAGQQKFRVDEYGNVTNVSNANISGNTVTMYDAPVTLDISKIYWNDALGKTEGTLENGETGTLSGAKLQLTANVSLANVTGSITVNHTDDNTLTWISGSKANTLRGLPDGAYTLSEIEAPAGYDAANAIAFTVSGGKITSCTTANTGDAYSDTSVTMCDKKTIYYSVKISKVDAETEDALSGATIGIFPAGTTSFVADNAVLVFNSSSAPEQMILANGDYILRELSAPEGYDLNDECICFNVNNGNVKITEVYTPTADINIGNPLESYEGLNWFADYVQFYTDITDYVAANNNMPPDKILVKIPSANSTEDIMTEITAYTVYLDANNQGVAGSHTNYESSWASVSASPEAAAAGGITTYVNNYSDGYDYYYITDFKYPNVDNVPVTNFDRGDYSTALLLLDVTGYQRYTSSESLWSSLGATVSIFYGDKEVVLGEKTETVEAKSAFSYGVVPVASWANFGSNYLYADITDLVTANEGWPTSITFSTNDVNYVTGISDLPTTIIFGNMEVANWNNTIFPSNYNSAWAGADGSYSYVIDCSSTNIAYETYAAEDHSADRIYMVINEISEDSIDLSTLYLEDALTPTLTFANGKTAVMEGKDEDEIENAYNASFGKPVEDEDIVSDGVYIDVTEYLSLENKGDIQSIRLTRPVADDNITVTNVAYNTIYVNGTELKSLKGSTNFAMTTADGAEIYTAEQGGSKEYKASDYTAGYVQFVVTISENGTERTITSLEEWEALGFNVEIEFGASSGAAEFYDLGTYSSTPIEDDNSSSGVLNPGDVTITGDASSGEPVIITLPNRLTPVADRYVHSVQLNKVDQTGAAITGNPATFLLYDSKGNPVRLSGSDGSYQFVYDAAGEIICEQADFAGGTATKYIYVSQLPAAINYELGALVDGLKLSATITSSNGKSVTLPTIAPTSVNGSWKNIDLSALGVTGGDSLTVTLTQTYADGQSATKAELDFVYPLTTSQAAGTIRVDNLELGDYYFVETEAPTNYKCDTGSINFTLTEWNTSDNPAKINAFNTELTGSLIIEKTDDTGRPLSGAQFVLYVGSDLVEGDAEYSGLYRYDDISVAVNPTNTVGTYTYGWIWGNSDNNVMTTGTDGKIKITGLPLGHVYYVKELTAAPGTSNSNEGKNLPALTVGSSSVEGTAYYDQNKLYGTALGEDITTYIPSYTWNDVDGDGIYEEGELVFSYVAESVTTYEGVISVTNKAFTTTINKVGEDNAFLPGAQLKLEPISDVDLSGVSGTTTVNGVSVNATLNSINEPILDSDGKITGYLFEYVSITWESGSDSMVLRGLPSGFYKLTEEKAPIGYAVAAPIYIYIDESGNAFYSATESTDTAAYTAASSNTVTMTDKKLTGTITLVKRDGTTNERISGVQFVLKCGDSYVTVTEANGKYTYKALAASGTTMTTASDGTIVVEGLPYGTTYTFVETVPAGYSVASTSTSVELTATELTKEVTVTNNRVNNGSITLIKTEKGTNTGLANAVFDLYSRKAGSGAAFTLHSSGHTTGSDGKVTVNNLAWGYDYKFVETAAADGYDKNTAASDTEFVTINSTTTGAVEYKVTNEKLLSLKVVKSWDDNGDQDGARPDSVEVKLYADGSEYASATLNSGNNWTYVFTGLPVVTESGSRISYSVDEPSVPAGYSKTGPVYDDQNGQWVITNSHTTATTGVTVTKKWNDSSNQDGLRPESVKVQLKANGTASGAEVLLNETNNWTYTWENLAVNAGGAPIAYTVEEVSVPNGYTAEVTGSMTDGFVITNTHSVLTTNISVSKSWNDSDNQDGIRPSSVTVQLMAGSDAYGDEITLNADNNWSYTWTGLAVNAGGTAINYTVVETNVKEGYTAGVSGSIADGFVITNSHNADVTSVSVRKNWNDANNQDGIRPSSVQVQLKANGTAIGDPVTLNSDNSWAYTWSDLALNAGGSAVAYTVEEVSVPAGYSASVSGSMAEGFVITNTHATATTGISVTKVWDDKNNQDGNRPGSVTVQLMAGSDAYGDEITLDSSNNWTYTWSGLAVNAGGSAINYTVVETNVASGYTATVSGSMTEGYTITNSYTPAETSVSVEKIWNDNSNQDGLRTGSVTVQLKANGSAYGEAVTLNADNSWKHTWTGLDKNSGGKAVEYTVEELNVPAGYTATVSGDAANGFKISNYHATASINVSVSKVWADNDNQDGKRTDSVTVQLMAGNTAVGDEVTLNADNSWTYTWTGLAAKASGVGLVYTVVETNVPAGYTSKVTGSIAEGFTVTNTHVPETTSISVSKEWNDGDDQDGLRPGTIIVKLLANGEEAGIQTNLSKANGWSFTWTDLPVYSGGSKINYTVVEADVPAGYTAQVTGNVTDGFVARNTHTPEVTDISVRKSWADNNNQDGIRPTSVQVQLKANGTAVGAAVTLNADNRWAYTWSDMAVYASGSKLTYTVEEVAVPDGYTAEVTGSVAEGFTVINTHATSATSVTVSKRWSDADNQDGIRPSSVTVQLKANGTAQGDEITLNADNNWTYTWSDLAVNADGAAISYTVEETNVPTGYTAAVTGSTAAGYIITNSHTPEVISVSVEKSWSDANNQDGKRTESVSVQLKADGVAHGSAVTLNADNNWAYTWTGLDKFSDGDEIAYTVEEVNTPDGYTAAVKGSMTEGFEITNSYTPAVTDISVTKEWVDNNDQDGKRTDSVTVQLMAGNTAVGDEITLNADNSWTYIWEDLAVKASGDDIVYSVVETNVPAGYTASYSGSVAEGFKVINTHTPEVTNISVTKEWVDNNDQDGLRPGTIIVKLLANGEEAGIQTNLSKANGWSFTWTDLPVYANGSAITYTVVEAEVPAGYTAQASGNVANGFVLTNTHTPAVTEISVNKVWNDNNNQDGKRTESVSVQLKANGTAVGDAVTLNESNSWTASWTGLAVYAGGSEIAYTVEEVNVPDGYTATVSGSKTEGFTITNSYTPESTSITVSKSWSDADNQDGIRPTSVTVQLKANGTAQGDEITLNAGNNWTYTWSDLDKKADGAVISYTVEETNVPTGYTAAVSGSAAAGYIITNSHTPEVIDISVEKSWSDANNQDGKRTESVSVQLKADGVASGDPVTLNKDNNWTYTWPDLDKFSDGDEIAYTVEEVNTPDGYTAAVKGSMTEGFEITNSYTPAVTDISVTKIWADGTNQDNIRPSSVTVQLKANGTAVGNEITLNADNSWTYIWEDLAVKANGTDIVYSVVETNVPTGYTASYSGSAAEGFKVTNTHTPAVTNISVTKEWVDSNDQDGLRSGSVIVKLLADGEEAGIQTTLSKANSWSFTWNDLPVYSGGVAINYTVAEVSKIDGYTSEVTGSAAAGFVITNRHTPETTDISVEKVWEDKNDQDGIRPTSVTVQLKADNVAVGTAVTLNKANDWSYTWNDLAVNANGTAITYTVEETAVSGYTVSYTGSVAEGFTVTNTHNPNTTTTVISKVDIAGSAELPGATLILTPAEGVDLSGVKGSITVTYNEKNGTISWVSGTTANTLTKLPIGEYTLTEITAPDGYEVAESITFSVDVDGNITIGGVEQDGKTVVMKDAPITVTISKKDINGTNELPGATLVITPSDENTDLSGVKGTVDVTYNETTGTISWVSGTTANTLTKLPAGEYTLTEITAPDGYEVAENITFVVNDKGEVIIGGVKQNGETVIMKDAPITVTISKQDINGTNELPGATLVITPSDENTDLSGVKGTADVTYDETTGTISWVSGTTANTLTKLPAGEYTLTEITAPDGYEVAENITFVVNDKGEVTIGGVKQNGETVVMKDAPITVTISKQDINGTNELPGATLVITPSDENTDLSGVKGTADVTYDETTGTISWVSGTTANTLTKLPAGEYTLTEITAPNGYEVAENITFVVNDKGEVTIGGTKQSNETVVMKDAPITVTISKQDINGTNELPGATLVITPSDENTDLSGVKGTVDVTYDETTGTISWVSGTTANTLTKLPAGEYTLTEITAPDGYEVAENITFVVNDKGEVTIGGVKQNGETVVMKDAPTTVTISKQDINGTSELPGATLVLAPADKKNDISGVKGSIDVTYDKETGSIKWVSGTKANTLSKLPAGEYTLTEITAPDGYEIAENITFVVNDKGEVTIGGVKQNGETVVMKDAPRTVTISKQDINGTNELPGATLVLTPADKKNDISGVKGSIDVTYDKDTGSIKWVSGTKANTLSKLPAGEYTLTEITAPDGYEVAENITFVVNDKGEVTIGGTKQDGKTVVMKDAPVTVTISKQDINGTDELPGATLVITPADETTDLSGVKGSIDVTYNKETGTISWVSGTKSNTLTKLPAGEYTLTEITAPDGYAVAENITFVVNDKGEVTIGGTKQNDETVVMKDAPLSVTISKQDINGTDELPGATLVLGTLDDEIDLSVVTGSLDIDYDEDENTITWVSGDKQNVLSKLPAGAYTLTEITAPDGYEVAEDITFTVNEKGEVYVNGKKQDGGIVVMKDAPLTITISKQDINGTDELPGATLVLTPDDEDIDLSGVTGSLDITYNKETGTISWVSGDKANELSKLPAGEYTLTELTAPNGYTVAEDIKFTVDEDGVVRIGGKKQDGSIVVMKDVPNEAVISKQAVGGGDELVGAELTVVLVAPEDEKATLKNVTGTSELEYSADGSSVTWISGSTANTLTCLPDGVYSLVEVAAPAGYKVATSMFFKVDNGVVYNTTNYTAATTQWTKADKNTVIMYDERISVAISFVKSSNLDKPLAGAVFTLTDANGKTKTATSGTNGIVSFDNLEQGTYTLSETSAPSGYTKSNKTVTVNIDSTGTVVWRDSTGYQILVADVEDEFTNKFEVKTNNPQNDLTVGDKIDLSDKLPDELGGVDVEWDSSDDSVASVDKNGNVTILKPGKVTITVTYKGDVVDSFVLGATSQNNNNNTGPNTGSDLVRIGMYVSAALLGAFGATTAVVYGVKRRRQNQA